MNAIVTSGKEFEGYDHGGVPVSLIVVDAAPGRGPDLHRHDYAEVFVVHDGEATFIAGDEERTVRAGEIVVVPAGGAAPLLQLGRRPVAPGRHPPQPALRDGVALTR
jgi:mannose-6-phosphate isomerase-like protein (cupin superfamily)